MSIISISGKIGSGKDTAGKIIQWLTHKHVRAINDDGNMAWVKMKDKSFETFCKYENDSPWKIKKWATPLRKIGAILLGMDEQFLYTDEFKKMVLPDCWVTIVPKPGKRQGLFGKGEMEIHKMTGREFLQKLGTDAIRNGLHKQSWMNATMSEYIPYPCSFLKDRNGVRMGGEKWSQWIMTDTRFPEELSAVKKVEGITIRINRISASAAAGTHESETALDNASFDYEVNNDGTIEELTEKLLPIILKFN